MSDIEYEDFSEGDVFRVLTESNDIRIEEEMTRAASRSLAGRSLATLGVLTRRIQTIPAVSSSVHAGQSFLRNGIPLSSIPCDLAY